MRTAAFGSRASRIAWALIETAVLATGAAGRQTGARSGLRVVCAVTGLTAISWEGLRGTAKSVFSARRGVATSPPCDRRIGRNV